LEYFFGGQVVDALVDVMREILSELQEINAKLDNITAGGVYTIQDVCSSIDDISSSISSTDIYSIDDVCSKLDSIETTIGGIATDVSLLG
jgi:hypothetical protein